MARARGAGSGRITPSALARNLAEGRPAPVYLLVGGEAILRDQALEALKRKQVDEEFEQFNYRTLTPSGLDASALVQELRVLPMGGGGRLVVIEPAEKLLKDQVKVLEGYGSDPSPGTCLVLVAGEAKDPLRRAFGGAVSVDCGSPWEDRIPGHLMEEAQALDVRLEPAAAEALAALCGRDLSRAVSELRKATVRAGAGGAVTRVLVEELAGGAAAGDVFKVASALARGDTVAAVGAARRYLETEERCEPRVLYELGLHLRRLLTARGNLEEGMPPRDAARAAGVFWKDLDPFMATLRRWDEGRIREGYRKLLEADRRVKRGGAGLPAIEACLWGLESAPPGSSAGVSRAGERRS
jgi:DNA polymerase-3 subunit delta